MKKGDVIWILVLAGVIAFLVNPSTNQLFTQWTKGYPFTMGFVKFFILATMGELLAIRIITGNYKQPVGLLWRAIIWGLLGMSFVIIFPLYSVGMVACAKQGLLPKIIWMANDKLVAPEYLFWAKLVSAYIMSAIINIAFAPIMMAFHRITDTYLDIMNGQLSNFSKVSLGDVVQKIDWKGFVTFVICKTIPIFWIPAHTITFMLPPDYRVLMAALLGIALGAILAFAKRKQSTAK